MGQLERESASIEAASPNAVRRAYVPPQLLEYGSVAKLTQGGARSMTDGNSGMAGDSRPYQGGTGAPLKMR
jgi:hypothetical protein